MHLPEETIDGAVEASKNIIKSLPADMVKLLLVIFIKWNKFFMTLLFQVVSFSSAMQQKQ